MTLDDRALPHTHDPIAYAAAVATSLFDWDTGAGFLPTDYTSAVLADADPSGEETPALLHDVATYLPTVESGSISATLEVRQVDRDRGRLHPRLLGCSPRASARPSSDPVRRR